MISIPRQISLMAVTLALATLCACAENVDTAPVYAADQCRRVAIVDAETGATVIGAEDLAYDAAGERLLISAYDRRAVERGVKKRADELAEGGIYAAPLAALAGDRTSLSLPLIVARETVADGLRPHGLSFDPVRREIAFINRSYEKSDGRWEMTPQLQRAAADGAVLAAEGETLRCSANDLATVGELTFVSFDHGACGWRSFWEDVFGSRNSGVATASGDTVFDRAGHANGVAALSADEFALAATREKALLLFQAAGDAVTLERRIALPGGPDNLTVSGDGQIIAALHPSLLGIGLQRRLGIGSSGSRIVRVDPDTETVTLLFDDQKGDLFSAATAAIEAQGMLVIGSVVDSGLLVCGQ